MEQLDLSIDGASVEDLKLARKVHDFFPPCFLEIVSDSSDLYTLIPFGENPVTFIINHLRNYELVNVFSIRLLYYDADYCGR